MASTHRRFSLWIEPSRIQVILKMYDSKFPHQNNAAI